MSDRFEKFVRDNRREFDSESPSGKLWEKVSSSLPHHGAKRFSIRDIYKWSAAAAIVVAVLTSGYFIVFQRNSHEPTPNSPGGASKGGGSVLVSPVYADEFNAVIRSIGEKEIELKKSTKENPLLYSQFKKDMALLDSAYQALMKQLEHSTNQDLLYQAIMDNLKLRLEILSRQVMISHEYNNNSTKSISHETSI
jgi:hypothetical protein